MDHLLFCLICSGHKNPEHVGASFDAGVDEALTGGMEEYACHAVGEVVVICCFVLGGFGSTLADDAVKKVSTVGDGGSVGCKDRVNLLLEGGGISAKLAGNFWWATGSSKTRLKASGVMLHVASQTQNMQMDESSWLGATPFEHGASLPLARATAFS